jgi:hypothetical protein
LDAYQLLGSLLLPDANTRLSVAAALEHAWLQGSAALVQEQRTHVAARHSASRRCALFVVLVAGSCTAHDTRYAIFLRVMLI